jgi:regulatory protein
VTRRSGPDPRRAAEWAGVEGEATAGPVPTDPDRAAPPTEGAVRGILLDALSSAARTRGQLEAMLTRKGVAPEVGERVLDRFEEVGLVDDGGYAQAFVESRHEVRGQGRRALAYELRRRGVADETIGDALGAVDDEREFATACRLAQNRARRLAGLPADVRLRRLAGFLARKGYSADIVVRAVRQAIDEADADADADEGSAGSWSVDA